MRLFVSFIILITLISCTQKEVKSKSNAVYTNSDSLRVLKYLDSLQVATDFENLSTEDFIPIDVSEFKSNTLRNIPFQLIPTELEGGTVDLAETKTDSLFDLVDPHNLANWVLFAKKPKFFVVLTDEGFLATLNYKFEKIDAIRYYYISPGSNNHWSFARHGTIDKQLSIVLHHEYSVQVDEEGNMETSTLDKHYYINAEGRILKKS
jgi:hypothetical protein